MPDSVHFGTFGPGEVFTLLGSRVALLVNGTEEAGDHQVEFDGTDLASGVYLYRLMTGGVIETKRFVLVR